MLVRDNAHTCYEKYFVARQPIVSRLGTCWGYELLFRSPENKTQADFLDASFATSQVIVDGLPLALENIPASCKVMINTSADMIRARIPLVLPKERCVIEILESTLPSSDILRELSSLKSLGYTLALDDYAGQEYLRPFLDMVDIVKVDFRLVPSEEKRRELYLTVKSLKGNPRLVVAEKVESFEEQDFALKCGYDLFQGYFLSRPELLESRKVPLRRESRLQLVYALSQDKLAASDLEKLISHDPVLFYRLLKFVNTARVSTKAPVQSAAEAIADMGVLQVRKWLATCIIADEDSCKIEPVLALKGVTRAYFFRWLAGELHSLDSISAFTFGLFSILDDLYVLPFKELSKDISLPPEVMKALCFNKGPLISWLRLVEALECGERQITKQLMDVGYEHPEVVLNEYQKAHMVAQY